MTNKETPKNSGEQILSKKEAFLARIKEIALEIQVALILRPQNYWMTNEMRQQALNELGFMMDENGDVYRITDDKKVDAEAVKKEVENLIK